MPDMRHPQLTRQYSEPDLVAHRAEKASLSGASLTRFVRLASKCSCQADAQLAYAMLAMLAAWSLLKSAIRSAPPWISIDCRQCLRSSVLIM